MRTNNNNTILQEQTNSFNNGSVISIITLCLCCGDSSVIINDIMIHYQDGYCNKCYHKIMRGQ